MAAHAASEQLLRKAARSTTTLSAPNRAVRLIRAMLTESRGVFLGFAPGGWFAWLVKQKVLKQSVSQKRVSWGPESRGACLPTWALALPRSTRSVPLPSGEAVR